LLIHSAAGYGIWGRREYIYIYISPSVWNKQENGKCTRKRERTFRVLERTSRGIKVASGEEREWGTPLPEPSTGL
jgi:hypothetical protein